MHIRKIDRHNEVELEFLSDMFYEAIHILENKPPKEELLDLPHIKKYSQNWGRKGDNAILAFTNENLPVGAAWFRLFTEDNKGYGYVDANTPELGIAVKKDARGKGVGKLLMKELFELALQDGFSSLSLSVDPLNKEAVQLYERLGFVQYGLNGTSVTMVYSLKEDKKMNKGE
ncbi:GNAT family N-acetyltransferase [Bacillus alkalicellulosilyticus]|uniref:GNAT family N-acetyltransferase n=1 Tax=Alkalihalobacterium alkalicellulosilyticum TaxID=1912214 RepID=UPI0009985325|nr:GNAT family N-acetyltransferase [Bacillus alkalicellulosilyticus]